jgi:hypothetical protein
MVPIVVRVEIENGFFILIGKGQRRQHQKEGNNYTSQYQSVPGIDGSGTLIFSHIAHSRLLQNLVKAKI